MAKKRLTGHSKEIHKQAVAIRKRMAAMPDEQLVELSKRIETANERAAVEQPEETTNKVSEFLEELENGSVPGIGAGKIQKMRELARNKQYI